MFFLNRENKIYKNLGGKKEKMRTKTLALLEIAIVLCSVFLVALPAITADQNQEMQKVSASTSAITAASEIYEPGPLDVFGNANGDDTIDMRDTTHIKLIIFGKKPKTDWADANYDGKISMLDVGQTKLIILGKEKELTYIDIFGEAEVVNKPIKRLAQLGYEGIRITRALGARDLIVAVGSSSVTEKKIFYPVISKLPAVGAGPADCDFEKLLNLKPDAIATNLESNAAVYKGGLEKKRLFEEKLPGMPLICLNQRELDLETVSRNVRTYGYILDREDEAEEYVDWYAESYNKVQDRINEIPMDERPRVYTGTPSDPYNTKSSKDRQGQAMILAGGRNIADEIPNAPPGFKVDPEWVIEQNPEFIILRGGVKPGGYDTDDPSGFAAARQDLLNRPELANVDAVERGEVYVLDSYIMHGGTFIGSLYMAKMFHSGLFQDIDPEAVHQEYLNRFCHIDFNVKEHGVFVYPPMEEWH